MILIDSSAWIEYIKGNPRAAFMRELIVSGKACVNEIILAELVPVLTHRGQKHIAGLLESAEIMPLNIIWKDIIEMQISCLSHGINNVGIPDLIIAQNAVRNGIELLTFDRHFQLLSQVTDLRLYPVSWQGGQ